ncbi:hypothetical protein ACSS6W_004172 [Trichoderma asperelloides]
MDSKGKGKPRGKVCLEPWVYDPSAPAWRDSSAITTSAFLSLVLGSSLLDYLL